MSSSDKPNLGRAWLRTEKLPDEEADRISAMSDEAFEREAAGLPDPAHIPTEEELDARSALRRGEHPEGKASRRRS